MHKNSSKLDNQATSPSCRCTSSEYCNEFYDTCRKLLAFFAKKIWCIPDSPSQMSLKYNLEIEIAKKMLGITTTEQYTQKSVAKVCRRILAAHHPDITKQKAGKIRFTTSDACRLLKEDLKKQKEEGALAWIKRKIFG